MLDLVAAILIVTAIILTCRIFLGLRLLTAVTVGMVGGWVISGVLLGTGGGFEDFDSDGISERRVVYSVFSVLMICFFLIHLVASSYREYRRHAQA